jgi:hypothetical protein
VSQWARDVTAVLRSVPIFEFRDVDFTAGTTDDGLWIRSDMPRPPIAVLAVRIHPTLSPSNVTTPTTPRVATIWEWSGPTGSDEGASNIRVAITGVVGDALDDGTRYTVRLLFVWERGG